DYGQAFYNDGTGIIVNYGQINLSGEPMADDDAHMGSQPTDATLLPSVIASAGETVVLDSDTGFKNVGTGSANYGNATLNGDLQTMGWLWNEGADSVLDVNGTLTVSGGGMENQGTLTADNITISRNSYNRATGSIVTKQLDLNKSDVSFFNEGDFTGTVTAASYTNNLVNSGTMTVTEDGAAAFSGAANIYNQAGATITNTGQAVEGGENALINITRTSSADTVIVNDGTLLAQNGYSAITTAQTGTTDASKWFINSATGVISGSNAQAPLVYVNRGYNFANEGTMTVQGDNAVGIASSGTSYTQYLVNSGTLNVGTQAGQSDGSNGTGLTGIQGGGKGTTVNNTASGVINVYAEDSYAFGGTAKQFINNGEVNLLCETNCGIFAPGTSGTQEDHSGVADITVPDASKTPSQGGVPTPPADSGMQVVSNYTVGTNADGSAGTLTASNIALENVTVDTGFTSGTAATSMTFNNVFTGSNIEGAD
ncbi:putative surface-exposed virulence protein, partial [Trabulsiella guamensis ATCC 49490]